MTDCVVVIVGFTLKKNMDILCFVKIVMKTKKEQLEKAFRSIIDKYIGNNYYNFTIDDMTKELLKEVTIRTNLNRRY